MMYLPKHKTIFLLALRIIIGALFIFSALSKMVELNSFIDTIDKFNIIFPEYHKLAAVLIISIEYLLGIFLILGIKIREVCFILVGLMSIFIVIITINLIRGNITECGCFGSFSKREIGLSIILQDMIILSLLLLLIFSKSHIYSFNGVIEFIRASSKTRGNVLLLLIALLNIGFVLLKDIIINDKPKKAIVNKQIGAENNMPDYGTSLDHFIIMDINGNYITEKNIIGKPTFFNFIPSVDAKLYVESLRYLKNKYTSKELQWIVVFKNWNVFNNINNEKKEIINIYKNADVSIVIDTSKDITQYFKLPDCKCPVYYFTDKQNRIRLSQISPDGDILDSTYYRIIRGEYENK